MAPLPSESGRFGDLDFTTTRFPAMASLALLTRLAQSLGPALAALSGVDPATDVADMAPSLMAALSSLKPSEMESLVRDLFVRTSVTIPDAAGGRRLDFVDAKNIDLVFSGKLKVMFECLWWVVRVNFSDFFPGSDRAVA